MKTPIIVPRDFERVLEFDIPAPLLDQIASLDAVDRLFIGYGAPDGIQFAASQDLADDRRATRLRTRLPLPPPGLNALRLAVTRTGIEQPGAWVDLPATAPALGEFANGSLTVGELPDEVRPGAGVILPLTLTNDSAYPWEPGLTGVSLRLDFGGEVRHLPLPCPVPPGEARQFTISVQAPSEPGERTLLCTPMLAPSLPFLRGRAFRPLRVALNIREPAAALADQASCRIDLVAPGTLLPDEPAMLALNLTNTGPIRIEASGPGCLRLRARWRREPRDGSPIRDTHTALLPHPLEPGETCAVALRMTTPSVAGRYKLDVLAEVLGYRTRLDDEHSICPPAEVTVADLGQVDRTAEQALRRDMALTSRTAERSAYRAWASHSDTMSADEAGALSGVDAWPWRPTIAVALSGSRISEATHFLQAQPYPEWCLVAADAVPEADLLLRWNTDTGLLAVHALLFLAGELVRDPDLTHIYADFNHLDENGQRHDRVFLPGPDPFFTLSQPAMHMISAERVGTPPGRIRSRHIPHALFHRFDGASLPHATPLAGTDDSSWRVVKMHDVPGYAVRPRPADPLPRVALIIPTRDRHDLLATFISTVLERTDYQDYELIVVDNGSQEPDTLAYLAWLEEQGFARVLRDDGPFNWSRLNNRAAAITDAPILCFLNNDMEVTSEGWLRELAALAARPDVGVAGATLWFPDGTIQHAGVGFSAQGAPLHLFGAAPRGTAPFYLRSLRAHAAVTGACLAVRRDVFDTVGGFDERFPIDFNDVDFCLRVRESLGLPAICSPHAELLHKESASRGRPRAEAERDRTQRDLDCFEGRHLETAFTDQWTDVVAHAAPRSATAVTRAPSGARLAARRYRRMTTPPLAFIHIPGTEAAVVREVLDRALPPRAVLRLGARAVVEGHTGDPATASRLAPLLRNAEMLFGPISHGFGESMGWECRYATILRDPRARVRAHHDLLVTPANAPLKGTPLAQWPLAPLVRKGIIPGNLMIAKILGERPETVDWPQIDCRFPRHAGFGLPPALWTGDIDALAALPDVAPDEDEAKIARALAIIEQDFLFVGLRERLAEHIPALGTALDIPRIGAVPRATAAPANLHLSAEDAEAVDRYNRLDQLLYDAIAALSGGLFLQPAAWAP